MILHVTTADSVSFSSLHQIIVHGGCLWQVEAHPQLRAVTAKGAKTLPKHVIEDAFKHQYDRTLNVGDFTASLAKLDGWYADRGIFGQVSTCAVLSWSASWCQRHPGLPQQSLSRTWNAYMLLDHAIHDDGLLCCIVWAISHL